MFDSSDRRTSQRATESDRYCLYFQCDGRGVSMRVITLSRLLVILAFQCTLYSCGSSDDTATQSKQPASESTPVTTPKPTVPNPDELAGMVARFYRAFDVPNGKPGSEFPTWSQHLAIAYSDRARWSRDYAYIKQAKLSVDGVHDRSVNYTVSFDYMGDGGFKLSWQRVGQWIFVHGSSGWQMDEDRWASNRVVSVTTSAGTRAVSDTTFRDGHHAFDFPGGRVTLSTSKDGVWKTAFAPDATPVPVQPRQPALAAPAADRPVRGVSSSAGCERVAVEAVYQDGEILKLDDGRHLRVASYETATTSVWVAPFDGLYCDQDDKFTNTDDSETVDLQP